jgi:hypothetical protein
LRVEFLLKASSHHRSLFSLRSIAPASKRVMSA